MGIDIEGNDVEAVVPLQRQFNITTAPRPKSRILVVLVSADIMASAVDCITKYKTASADMIRIFQAHREECDHDGCHVMPVNSFVMLKMHVRNATEQASADSSVSTMELVDLEALNSRLLSLQQNAESRCSKSGRAPAALQASLG